MWEKFYFSRSRIALVIAKCFRVLFFSGHTEIILVVLLLCVFFAFMFSLFLLLFVFIDVRLSHLNKDYLLTYLLNSRKSASSDVRKWSAIIKNYWYQSRVLLLWMWWWFQN